MTYEIPRFTYEILYVKIDHILNLDRRAIHTL